MPRGDAFGCAITDDKDEGEPMNRLPGLDLLRAIAIAWVMIFHSYIIGGWGHYGGVEKIGWMGVDLFFVLSGFLIAGQLLKPWANGRKPAYRRFYLRRALRTLPAFAVVVMLYFTLPQLRETPDIQPLWQFATFTENLLFDATSPKAFDQVWSLCVEEQFYLLFPLALSLLAIKPSVRKTIAVLLAIMVAGIVVRALLWLAFVAGKPFDVHSEPNWQDYVTLIYYPTWGRLDGLLAGIGLAALKVFRPMAWKHFVARPNLLLAAGLAGIGIAMTLFAGPVLPVVAAALGFPLLAGSVALIVAGASTGRGLVGKYRIPGGAPLATGAYSLYLTHKMAYHASQTWISPALGATGYAALALALTLALAAGAALYWTVERPFLLLRDRLQQKASTPLASELLPAL